MHQLLRYSWRTRLAVAPVVEAACSAVAARAGVSGGGRADAAGATVADWWLRPPGLRQLPPECTTALAAVMAHLRRTPQPPATGHCCCLSGSATYLLQRGPLLPCISVCASQGSRYTRPLRLRVGPWLGSVQPLHPDFLTCHPVPVRSGSGLDPQLRRRKARKCCLHVCGCDLRAYCG